MFLRKMFTAIGIMAITLCLGQSVTTADDFSLKFGKEFEAFPSSTRQLFRSGDHIMSINFKYKIFLESIDIETLLPTRTKEFIYSKDIEQNRNHEQFVQGGDKVYEFLNQWDAENNTENILVRSIDIKTLEVSDPKTLFSTDYKMKSGNLQTTGATVYGVRKIEVLKSENENRFLLKYNKYPINKDNNINKAEVGLVVLNEKMEILWDKVVEMPLVEAEIYDQRFFVNDFGEVFIMNFLKEGNNTKFQVVKYGMNNGTKEVTIKHNVTLPNSRRSDFDYQWHNNNLYIATLDGIIKRNSTGVYIVGLDRDCVVIRESHIKFQDDFLYKGMDQKKVEKLKAKGKSSLNYFHLNSMYIEDNGEIAFFAEEYSILEDKSHYEDILFFKISSDNKMLWANIMKKHQYGYTFTSPKFFGYSKGENEKKNDDMSFKQIKVGGFHYLILKDDVANFPHAIGDAPKLHRMNKIGIVVGLKINDKTGEATKLPIFATHDYNGKEYSLFKTDWLVDMEDNSLVFPLYIKETKKFTFVKMAIKN